MKTIIYSVENRKSLPDSTGVYCFSDSEGEVLYIGKSVNLKSRVNSYFIKRGEGEGPDKFLRMQRFIAFIEAIPTPTELEAEWLEQSLIERHQPQYNQQMKSNARYGFLMPEAGIATWQWRVVPLGKHRVRLQGNRETDLLIGPFRNPKIVKERLKILNNFKWLEDWFYQPLPIIYSKGEITKIISWIKERFDNKTKYYQWIQKLRQERDLAAKNLEFEKAGRFQEVIESIAPVGNVIKRKQLLYQGDPPFMIDRKNKCHCGYFLKNGVLFRKCWKSNPKESDGELKEFILWIDNSKGSIEEDRGYQQWRLRNLDQEMILYRAFVKQEGQIIGCGIKANGY